MTQHTLNRNSFEHSTEKSRRDAARPVKDRNRLIRMSLAELEACATDLERRFDTPDACLDDYETYVQVKHVLRQRAGPSRLRPPQSAWRDGQTSVAPSADVGPRASATSGHDAGVEADAEAPSDAVSDPDVDAAGDAALIAEALDALPQELVVVDAAGRVVRANAAWWHACGSPSFEDEPPHVVEAWRASGRMPEGVLEQVRAGLEGVLSGREPNFAAEYAPAKGSPSGTRRFVMSAWPLPKEQSGAIVWQEDVTDQRRFEAELADRANRDALTGLPNRRLFMHEGARMLGLARRRGWRMGLIYVDLDGFKQINDERGHEVGDAVLAEVASRLHARTRSSDVLARLAGDEFVVLLHDVGLDEVGRMVARYREAFAEPLWMDGNAIELGASLGVASVPGDGQRLEQLLARADAAMYREKAARGGSAPPRRRGRAAAAPRRLAGGELSS